MKIFRMTWLGGPDNKIHPINLKDTIYAKAKRKSKIITFEIKSIDKNHLGVIIQRISTDQILDLLVGFLCHKCVDQLSCSLKLSHSKSIK